MAERLEKVPIALAEPEDAEPAPMPPAYSAVMAKPSSTRRLLRIGAMVLIGGAILLLLGAMGAFYYWKVTDKEVYNIHYMMSINGKAQEVSMEIDPGNNLETFKTGGGGEEAIEVHDFQNGVSGIRFSGGEKCYIKAQAKSHIPEVSAMIKERLSLDLEGEIMPAKFAENSLIWVTAGQPIKNKNFLSPKILELCGDLQIFWLRPSYPKVGRRKKREATRKARQAQSNLALDQSNAAAEEVNTRPRTTQRTQQRRWQSNATRTSEQDTQPAFNPDNPYHQLEGGEGMTFDPRLDHEGVCCIECRRSYTHCQRICEPLLGYYPWPYNYQGCRSACRLIMPCSWWVARILGVV
ncbi:leukocyte cell-derived chemotaxin 1 [Zootoca vivipara]|uniref:leukocyte cell-derived chemotaxin 1 n=1 Tax=Zootoca vivipara TaxID=8524 RepID=UPI00293BC605|nr:leukocyte cell-derived chemotaxin 1 [Zootoca vivipara]